MLAARLMLALALALPVLSSCATIVTGDTDSVQVLSNPPGANFETNTGHRGTTPSTIEIADSVTLDVRCWMDGWQESKGQLPPTTSGWIAGNIILGGIIGLAVDFASGQYRTHDKMLTITLLPLGPDGLPVALPVGNRAERVADGFAQGVRVEAAHNTRAYPSTELLRQARKEGAASQWMEQTGKAWPVVKGARGVVVSDVTSVDGVCVVRFVGEPLEDRGDLFVEKSALRLVPVE